MPIFALSFLLAAMPGAAQTKNPDTYVFLRDGDPADSLDPAWTFDGPGLEAVENVYDFLVGFQGSSLALDPRLSESVPTSQNGLVSADGRTYTFPIRKGVKFHDGRALSPDDVKYSLMRMLLQDRAGGPAELMLLPIAGRASTRDAGGKPVSELFRQLDDAIRVEGDRVSVRLPKPYAPFLSILASFGAVVSRSWCRENGGWDGAEASWVRHNNPKKQDSFLAERANGTGPFRLERLDRAARTLVLERNDAYWRGPAALRRVIVRSVPDPNTKRLMLEAGDADAFYGNATLAKALAGAVGIRVVDNRESPRLSVQSLHFNGEIEPSANPDLFSGRLDGEGIPPDFFDDPDVRKGVAFAIDYDAAVRDAFPGSRRAGGYIPSDLPGAAQDAGYRHDPKAAERHFRKARAGAVWEKGFRFGLVINDLTADRFRSSARLLKQNLEALNPRFRVEVRLVQWPTYIELRKTRRLPAHFGGWTADYPDADNFAVAYFSTEGEYSRYSRRPLAGADALVERARAALEPKDRAEAYALLTRQALEHAFILPIAEGAPVYRAERDWVRGSGFRPIFSQNQYFYSLSKDQR